MSRREKKAAKAAARAVVLEYVRGNEPMGRYVRWVVLVTTLPHLDAVRGMRQRNSEGLRASWFDERMRAHGAPEDWLDL